MICPHCGAENPDYSSFCSLCLARFAPPQAAGQGYGEQKPAPGQQPPQPYVAPGDYRSLAQEQQYVSPGDYHSLPRDAQQGRGYDTYRDSAYYQAAMKHPGSIGAAQVPAWIGGRSTTDRILMVLKYSFLTFWLLFGINFVVGLFIFGAAFGGSEASFNIGIALLYVADMVVYILGGYYISARAMEPGKGWMYGLACVAAVVFIWQPLISLFIILIISGEFFVPVFNLVGLMVALFLDLPMGALGGWIAERRYVG